MNASLILRRLPLLIIFILLSGAVTAQTDSLKELKKANKWVKGRAWAKHLKMKVYADVNSVEFEHQYKANKSAWDKAFQFLADSAKLATLAPGKYPIDGDNAYASITDGPTLNPDAARWESHRKYIDLQYVIRGEEKIGVAPASTATVIVPYNEAKDAANYTADGKYYTATPEEFYLFFPSDAHKPSIKVDGFNTDKKLVIKIRYVN